MRPEDAPVGTVAVIGHPANGVTARKATNGKWYYTHQHDREVDYDDLHKAAEAVYIPRETS